MDSPGMHKFDTRAALAILALVGAIGYQVYIFAVLQEAELQIPAWMSAVVMGCIGHYFGSKSSESNGKSHVPPDQ